MGETVRARGRQRLGVIIALLAVLGVDLLVIVVLLAVVLSRRRWVSRQPGSFKGAIRIIDGEVPGLGAKWKRGYGRWVRGILGWTKAPLSFRNELVVAERLAAGPRTGEPAEEKRLGKQPTVVALTVEGGGRIEVAASVGEHDRVLAPFDAPSGAGAG